MTAAAGHTHLSPRARRLPIRQLGAIGAVALLPIPLLVLSGVGLPLPGVVERGLASLLPDSIGERHEDGTTTGELGFSAGEDTMKGSGTASLAGASVAIAGGVRAHTAVSDRDRPASWGDGGVDTPVAAAPASGPAEATPAPGTTGGDATPGTGDESSDDPVPRATGTNARGEISVNAGITSATVDVTAGTAAGGSASVDVGADAAAAADTGTTDAGASVGGDAATASGDADDGDTSIGVDAGDGSVSVSAGPSGAEATATVPAAGPTTVRIPLP
jgi:hypothetical protein